MKRRWIICGIIALGMGWHAVPRAPGQWLIGTSLERHLSDPVDLVWSENPLREALAHFAQVEKVAVLLDRRIDPGRKITLSLRQATLGDALAAIAMNANIGAILAGPLAYFGPPETAAKVRTLIFLREEEAKKLSPAAAKKWMQAKPLAWANFAQPREIAERLGRENDIAISALEKIPYDLWAAADLPPMTLVERFTLILVQHDLTFAIAPNGKSIELVPLPKDIRLTRSYPGGKNPATEAKKFAELAPQAEIEARGDKVFVRALLEDHERIAAPAPAAGRASPKNAAADLNLKRFTLTVAEKPIGPLLKQLAQQIGLQLQMDEAALAQAGVSLEQRVSFQVEGATIDQLLQAAIKETPLQYRRQGSVLTVEALKQGRGVRGEGREK